MDDRFGQDHLHHRGDRPGRRPRRRGGPEARPSRPGPGATHQRYAMARPVGRRADRRRPGRSRGAPRRRLRGRLDLQLRRQGGDWGRLEEFRRLNVEALRLLLDAACEARVERLVHVSSLGVYEGRDHHGTDETVAPCRQFPRRLHPVEDRGRGPGAGLPSEARTARGDRPAGLHLRRARPDRPAQAAHQPPARAPSPTSARASSGSTASTSRTWSRRSSWPPRARRPSARSST